MFTVLLIIIAKPSDDFGRTITLIIIPLAGSLVLGAIGGLISASKIFKMKIILSDNKIEVVKGAAQGSYLLEDFVECKMNEVSGGKTAKDIQSLIFNGEEELLFIDCNDFSYYEFLQIADAIRVRKHIIFNKEKAENRELLPAEHYLGINLYDNARKVPTAVYILAALFFPVCGAVAYFAYSNVHTQLTRFLFVGACVGTIVIAGLIVFDRIYFKKNEKRIVKEMSFSSSDLKINDDVWNYNKIQSIYITQPYLTAIDNNDARVLEINGYESPNPILYILETRPKSYDSSDNYTKLYNRIISLCKSNEIRIEPLWMPKNKKRIRY